MKFKKEKIVFEEVGENLGTISPVCLLSDFTGDLSEKVNRFISWDFDMPIECNKYQVLECTIPDVPDWLEKHISIRYAIGLSSIEALENLTENQFHQFLELGDFDKYIFGSLWEKRKNPFCLSLFNQIIGFLERKANGEKTHQRPLSANQYNAVEKFRIYKRDAENISGRIYNSRY